MMIQVQKMHLKLPLQIKPQRSALVVKIKQKNKLNLSYQQKLLTVMVQLQAMSGRINQILI